MFSLPHTFLTYVQQQNRQYLEALQTSACWWVLCEPEWIILCQEDTKDNFVLANDAAIADFQIDADKCAYIATQEQVVTETRSTDQGLKYRYYLTAQQEMVSCLLCLESSLHLASNASQFRDLYQTAYLVCTQVERDYLQVKYIDERCQRLAQEKSMRKNHDRVEKLFYSATIIHQLISVFLNQLQVQGVLTELVKVLRQVFDLNQSGIFIFNKEKQTIAEICISDADGNIFYKSVFKQAKHSLSQLQQLTQMAKSQTVDFYVLKNNYKIDDFIFSNKKTVALFLKNDSYYLGFLLFEYSDVVEIDEVKNYVYALIIDILKTGLYLKKEYQARDTDAQNTKNLMEKRFNEFSQKIEKLKAENVYLSEQALLDPLTGLANRRCLEISFRRELENAIRYKYPLSLVLIDIDFFKNYNDYYGHDQGDQCLKDLAQVLQQAERRKGSLVVRYGGEEFLILLPHQEISEAGVLAQRIQTQLKQASIAHADSRVSTYLTVSIGYTSTQDINQPSWETLFKQADTALYAAKKQGRNQAVAYTSDLSPS